jgi:glycosyltransferase involved in cell wall biosynthesis
MSILTIESITRNPHLASGTSRIRIAFCITDLDPGGAERALVHLVTRLDRSRFEPQVYCLSSPGQLVETLQAADIPVTCLGARRWWQLGLFRKLTRELRRFQPDLLQTFLFHANLAGRWAGRRAGVPHIVSGIRVAERRRNVYLRLERWTESLVEKHVCVSQAVADYSRIHGGLNPQKLCVIPNGVDFQKFATAAPANLAHWGISPEDNAWITVGRLDPQKGPWDLLSAVEKLRSQHPRLKLLWAGEGPLRGEMQQWIGQHQLADTIRLIGWQADIPGLLKAAKGFVLCSHWEGMPNVILEAMSAGLPVISTNVEGVSEIITNDQTGWLVDTPANFATRWDSVLRDPHSASEVAIAGQQHVRDHFTWDTMAERYMALYEQLLLP